MSNIASIYHERIPVNADHLSLLQACTTVRQLRDVLKIHRLRTSGTKKYLARRWLQYENLIYSVRRIQRCARARFRHQFVWSGGPATVNPSTCVNECDVLSMESLTGIPPAQFFSVQDGNMVYGFDMVSFFSILKHASDASPKNPYTNLPMPAAAISQFETRVRLGKLLKAGISTELSNSVVAMSRGRAMEMRALTLFQAIDALGFYSDHHWFTRLTRSQIILLLDLLLDIWTYRTTLSIEYRRQISPPNGNPYMNTIMPRVQMFVEPLVRVQTCALGILERLVFPGVDHDHRWQGAFYVLGALTMVSAEASMALPWVFSTMTEDAAADIIDNPIMQQVNLNEDGVQQHDGPESGPLV